MEECPGMILGIFGWRWHGESRDLRKWENQRQHIRRWQIDDEGLLQVKHGEEVGAGNQMDRFSGDLCGDFGISSFAEWPQLVENLRCSRSCLAVVGRNMKSPMPLAFDLCGGART